MRLVTGEHVRQVWWVVVTVRLVTGEHVRQVWCVVITVRLVTGEHVRQVWGGDGGEPEDARLRPRGSHSLHQSRLPEGPVSLSEVSVSHATVSV